jgi:hypothetical protein
MLITMLPKARHRYTLWARQSKPGPKPDFLDTILILSFYLWHNLLSGMIRQIIFKGINRLRCFIPGRFTMATNIRVEPLEEPAAAKVQKDCRSPTYHTASVRVFPSGCAHTSFFLQHAQRFRDFEIREDDVWIVTYPKCGKHKTYYCWILTDAAYTN